jgi:Carboxypeptidase regulatory-like domain
VAITAPGRAAVRTGSDGTFVLDDVPPGLVTLRFSKAEHVDGEEIVSVPAGGEAKLDVALRKVAGPRPAAVTGLVRGENGSPVAARVRVVELGRTVDADDGGHFRFEVPPGHYTLVIEASGYVVQRKSVEVAAGEHNIYDVDLQRAP